MNFRPPFQKVKARRPVFLRAFFLPKIKKSRFDCGKKNPVDG
jgi:hypothetical protein